MDNLVFDLNTVWREVIVTMEEQGVFDQEAYNDTIDEVLEEKRELGELDDDSDIEDFRHALRHRWSEAQEEFESGHSSSILEQE